MLVTNAKGENSNRTTEKNMEGCFGPKKVNSGEERDSEERYVALRSGELHPEVEDYTLKWMDKAS